jgi:hypothetical protein
MCIVSNVGDDWQKRKYPDWTPDPNTEPKQWPFPKDFTPWKRAEPTREEFDELKKEMEELRKLLIEAKKKDEAAGTPDCEMEHKVFLIKELAKLVGVDMSEVFK